MSDDSDDDFERFLQDEDSASMSSASPVKTKVSSKKKESKSSTNAVSKASTKTDKGVKPLSGSLSVLSAAEKLLAASGRAKAKAKPIVEEHDQEEDEAPPPYSYDPYAFDLGSTAYFQEDDTSSKKKRGSSRKSSSSAKDTNKTSSKTRKSQDLRGSTQAKPEVKPGKTLEERTAEILKRTGSTTAISNVVSDRKDDSDEDGGSDKSEAKSESTPQDSRNRTAPVASRNESLEGSRDELGSHRLSFSDSLGMESADFEVGTHAKRKLDRSHLSLSSLNSEKFAVNMNALDESELVSNSRYERPSEPFHASSDTPADDQSEYGDDGFELDQTNDNHTVVDAEPPREGEQLSPFMSEFEKMKRLFSLDSPPKPVEAPVIGQGTTAQTLPPVSAPDTETFGYDDEDFETDDAKDAGEQSRHTDTSQAEEYGEDGFEDEPQVTHAVATEPPMQEKPVAQLTLPEPYAVVPSTVEPRTQPEDASATEVRVNPTVPPPDPSPPPSIERPVSRTPPKRKSITPPLSPPPPPPPEEPIIEHVLEQKPHSTVNVLRSQLPVHKSVDRIRGIEQQVSALRFLRDSIPKPTRATEQQRDRSPSPPPIIIVADDAEIAEEMKEIENLVDQARRSRSERTRRRQSLSSTSAKEHELALRLQQAQRQLLHFKQHVQDLVDRDDDEEAPQHEADDDATPQRASNGEDSPVHSQSTSQKERSDEVAALRTENQRLAKEVATQERLIQGFQRENEQLMKQLKQLQRDLHYDVHQQNEALRVQLRDLRAKQLDVGPATHVAGTGGDRVDYHAAIQARLQAEALAASLQEDLNTQASRHQERVNELKLECEKLKKAKRELECKYEGVDLEKMDAESREIKALTEQLATQKTEHQHTITAMQKKIDWYVNNQRLLDAQDEDTKAMKDEIKQLKETLAAKLPSAAASARSPAPPSTRAAASRSPADIRRIQDLETRLSDMEEAMRRRHPDSLVSLMVASRKAEEASTIRELKQQHEAEVAQLKDEMDRAETENEKRLVTFRQQQEKLVAQYQKQLADLERQLHQPREPLSQPKGTAKKSPVPDDIMLQRVRKFYTDKLKEVERKWEAKYRSMKKQHYAATGAELAEPSEATATQDTVRVIRSLQAQIQSQEDELKKLRGSSGEALRQHAVEKDLRRRVASLETQLQASEAARRHLVDTLASLHSITSHPPAPPSSSVPAVEEANRAQMENEYKTKLEAAQLQYEAALTDFRGRVQTLETQVATHVATIEALRGQLQDKTQQAEAAVKQLQDANQRAAAVESELIVLRDRVASPQTPSMLQFRSLELRIETLTQKHQLREAELRVLLAQATQSSRLEKLQYERMVHTAVALKNAEIATFKQQLGDLLDELESMRHPSPAAY